MKLPRIHPKDRAWLRARLRANLHCTICLGLLCAVIRLQPPGPIDPSRSFATAASIESPSDSSSTDSSSTSTEQVNVVSERSGRFEERISVPPTGWRRTKDGWQHVSTWHDVGVSSIRNINDLIAEQHQREPKWIRTVLAAICRVPPLTIAMLQLTAVAAIVFVADSFRRHEQ